MQRLCWKKVRASEAGCGHVSFQSYPGTTPAPLHTHDFCEILWIERGEARHHVNGEVVRLTAGDLAMIRPGDRHAIGPRRGGAMAMFNIAFPFEVVEALGARYFSGSTAFWGESSNVPATRRLSEAQVRWLRSEAECLAAAADSPLALDRFLLNLLHELGASQSDDPFRHCPEWLRAACEALHEPARFRIGPRALASLSGRSFEHVSRVLKRCAGLTPGEVTTRCRLDHAAALLVTTDRSIAEIALDCGYESLGHFYARFGRRYGVPPRRYRLEHRKGILPG